MALELSRLKRTQEAERVFGSSLPLLLARETLEDYVLRGPGDGAGERLAEWLRACASPPTSSGLATIRSRM